jgi:hypothetical protein
MERATETEGESDAGNESRRSGIRTHDLFHPKEARYQAALYADTTLKRVVSIKKSAHYATTFLARLSVISPLNEGFFASSSSNKGSYSHFYGLRNARRNR